MYVLIADDHPLVRDALARIVRQLDPQVRVDEAGDFGGVLRMPRTRTPTCRCST